MKRYLFPESQQNKIRKALTNALSALGDLDGDCEINQCEGCKWERREAVEWIEEALKPLGGAEPWLEELRTGKKAHTNGTAPDGKAV